MLYLLLLKEFTYAYAIDSWCSLHFLQITKSPKLFNVKNMAIIPL